MIIDDRLETVLRTQAASKAGQNTQLLQLVDILGRTPDHAWTDSHGRALDQLTLLHGMIGDAFAAILIRSSTPCSARLVAHLVSLGPRTALAAIDRARLDDEQWLRLIPALPIHARGALRHRRDLSAPVVNLLERLGIDDFVLSGPEIATNGQLTGGSTATEPASAVIVALPVDGARRVAPAGPELDRIDPPQRGAPAREGIGAIVRRIEAFRRTRDSAERDHETVPAFALAGGQAALPFASFGGLDRPASAIDVAINTGGMIFAADGVDPGMVVGHAPFVTSNTSAPAFVDANTLAAFRKRQPIVAGAVHLKGAPQIAGAWRIDAVPVFVADGGQFTGYRARLRRPSDQTEVERSAPTVHPGADALHQLLHELRTPINAVQGFAELIQQQMLGPTPHQYRSIAASIAADAARMLAGFEDVERLIRLETGQMTFDQNRQGPGHQPHDDGEPKRPSRINTDGNGPDGNGPDLGGTDLVTLLTRLVAQLEPLVAPREIRLNWTTPDEPVRVAMPLPEAERTLWRLLATLVSAAAPGERLSAWLDLAPGQPFSARLRLTLPQALALRDNEALFAPEIQRGGFSGTGMHGLQAGLGGMLGSGFALRLSDAELRAAGGGLNRPGPVPSAVLDIILPLVDPLALDRNAIAS